IDQQGWEVHRFAVRVDPPPVDPDPNFPVEVVVPTSIPLGESFLIISTVRNDGASTDDGRISVSFPTLTVPTDQNSVIVGNVNDSPGFVRLPAGSTVTNAACESMVSPCLLAEYRDNDWTAVGTETNTYVLMVTPQVAGDLPINVRATFHRRGGGPCDVVNDLPPAGLGGFTDAQGWPVKRYVVSVTTPPVLPRPDPVFPTAIAGVPASIVLGENFTITATVRNARIVSDDARIVVEFPGFTQPGDVGWVDT